jgi:hypothetical protein
VTARIWRLADGEFGSEAVDQEGRTVLKDGRAEFSD